MVFDDMENPLWVYPLWASDHLPFGETIFESGSAFDPLLRYPGQWAVPEGEGLGLTELFYNGYRWYRPDWGRYTQSDPIGLQGGLNLFAYVGGRPLRNTDSLGLAYFMKRPLKGPHDVFWIPGLYGFPIGPTTFFMDKMDIQVSHEQLFFEDGKQPDNVGLFASGMIGPDPDYPGNKWKYHRMFGKYNDCVMRMAINAIPAGYYNLLGIDGCGAQTGPGPKLNCQDYASAVRREYKLLLEIPGVRRQCCVK